MFPNFPLLGLSLIVILVVCFLQAAGLGQPDNLASTDEWRPKYARPDTICDLVRARYPDASSKKRKAPSVKHVSGGPFSSPLSPVNSKVIVLCYHSLVF